MARSFIYADTGMHENTILGGSLLGGTFTTDATVTNPEKVGDQSISTAFTDCEQNAGIRVDLGADSSPNVVALYHTIAENNDVSIYASDDTSVGSSVGNTSGGFSAGWTIVDITVSALRYVYIVNDTANEWDFCSEIIVGTKYDFAVNPELNAKTGEEFGTDIMTSYGGNEYANKRHEPKTTWDWNWSHILSTQKTALESLNASVQDWKKFIYSEDATTHHYVRMTKPVTFTEVAPSVFSANMSLREQLS